MLVANAVGLIVAASLLDGMSLNWEGLLWATVIYTVGVRAHAAVPGRPGRAGARRRCSAAWR